MDEPLVTSDWIMAEALALPLHDDPDMQQLLILFGEYVLIEAEREHRARIAALRERAQEIPQ